ncbi:hypothetical protein FRC08_003917 [Ceratobasidium sp. 394]|nr:hypothetical protein FRC08_003917 [Ceratobasidium sp. 394]
MLARTNRRNPKGAAALGNDMQQRCSAHMAATNPNLGVKTFTQVPQYTDRRAVGLNSEYSAAVGVAKRVHGVSSAYQTWSGGSTARPVGERIEAGQAKPTASCPPPERIESWLAQVASCPTEESTSEPAAKPGRLCPPVRTTTTASTPGRYPDPPKSHPFSLDRPDMTHVVTPALPMQFQSPSRRHVARIRVPPHNNADEHGARYFPPVFNIENPCMVESESKRQESERKMNTYPGEITPHPQRRAHKSKAQQDVEDIAYLRKLIDDKKRLNRLREALPKLRASKTDLLVEVLGELQCSTNSPEYEPSKWCISHSNTRTRAEGRDKSEGLDASRHKAEGRVNLGGRKKRPHLSPGVMPEGPTLPGSPAENAACRRLLGG